MPVNDDVCNTDQLQLLMMMGQHYYNDKDFAYCCSNENANTINDDNGNNICNVTADNALLMRDYSRTCCSSG
jgi:hypothetical protein